MPASKRARAPRTVRLILTRGDLLTLIRGLRDAGKSQHVSDLDATEYGRLETRLTEQFQVFNQEEK